MLGDLADDREPTPKGVSRTLFVEILAVEEEAANDVSDLLARTEENSPKHRHSGDVELICVRHGRTTWNAGNRFQGQTDIPLDDEGRAQATALAALLRGQHIDAAVSSDLSRAVETARIVLGPRDVALRLDPDWREMRFGDWEGLTWQQICAANPQLDPTGATSVKAYTPRGGESFADLCARVRRAAERIAGEVPADGVALVATHAGPLHALLSVLIADELKVRFSTASITRFQRSHGVWTLTRLNQTAQP